MKNVTIGSAVGMIRRRSCADSGGPARVPSPVKVVRLVLCVAAHVGLKVTATHSASWCHCGCGACTMAGCGHCTWQNKELFLKGKLQAAVQLGSESTRLLFVVGCLGLVFNASLITCRKFAWPYLGKATAAAHSYQCVQQFCVSKPWCGCQCLGFLTCAQMLMHATAHGGCMNIVRESVLKVDLEWKIPYHIGRLNPWQYCTWLFSPMLYQLNYPAPTPRTLFSHPFLGHDSQKSWGGLGDSTFRSLMHQTLYTPVHAPWSRRMSSTAMSPLKPLPPTPSSTICRSSPKNIHTNVTLHPWKLTPCGRFSFFCSCKTRRKIVSYFYNKSPSCKMFDKTCLRTLANAIM